MSILLPIIAASRRRLDPDAADYFARIVSAGSSISDANKAAVNAFIVGCKADGIWSAIKASCLLAGPNDLTGALVPLVGAAPTNVGPFVSGDYNRTAGITAPRNGTKYLNTNRAQNADPRDNVHLACWVGAVGTNTFSNGFIGSTAVNPLHIQGNGLTRCRSSTVNTGMSLVPGFFGISRSSSASYVRRANSVSSTITQASVASESANTQVFYGGTANARISFYSIGENINLAQLDARITTYMASLT